MDGCRNTWTVSADHAEGWAKTASLREPRANYSASFRAPVMSATATTRTLRRARPLLLIEPAAVLRPVVVKMLEGAGYVLTVATDWHQGMELAGGDYELIVLGWKGGAIDASAIAMIEPAASQAPAPGRAHAQRAGMPRTGQPRARSRDLGGVASRAARRDPPPAQPLDARRRARAR